ncbi:MAG TPA: galactosyldiacylglycerol synthase, partial [Variovorax sp.]|nr:galactosyldiacylglycerol synthase [Variovorax sp.]
MPKANALPASRAPVVDLVYFNAGGGHRASALALEAAIARAGLGWTVRLVNLREMLDPKDGFRKLTGMDPEDLYNKRLARGWTMGLAQELKLLQGLIRWGHAPLVRQLQRAWLEREPDMVVSLIPNFNRPLYEALAASLPGVPYATVLTDLADYPPHFWMEPDLPIHLLCGSARAVAQARSAGLATSHIHETSGMLIRTAFYDRPAVDRAAERARLGLDPQLPTGMVLFGGQGSKAMLNIAKRLPDTQL